MHFSFSSLSKKAKLANCFHAREICVRPNMYEMILLHIVKICYDVCTFTFLIGLFGEY